MRPARLIALSAMLALAACQQQAAKQETPAAAPEAKPGMAVIGGRLVLPAVKGNPGAAYFTLENTGSGAVSLAMVAIDGAGKTEVHQTLTDTMAPVERIDVDAGSAIDFTPGELHVMAFDLDPKLAAGGKTEMTLTFADGDKLSAELAIESAGAAAMDDMDHGDGH
jgi:periplasmic copper chaperone A